jgi:hypothetical protein
MFAVVVSGAVIAQGAEKEPARIDVQVGADSVAPGETVRVTVTVVPYSGIKINRYPKIKVTVDEVEGLVGSAEATVGNPKPPPVEDPESNYFKKPEAVELGLPFSADASSGPQEIEAKIKYFYCVTESGYCAPARAELTIPVNVR